MNFVVESRLRPAERALSAATPAVRGVALAALQGARQEVGQALDFALQNVGLSFRSAPIWLALLAFLKAAPEATTHDSVANRDALRAGYHRALAAPHAALEALWAEYGEFERRHSQPALVTALQVCRGGGSLIFRGCCQRLRALPPPPPPLPPPRRRSTRSRTARRGACIGSERRCGAG